MANYEFVDKCCAWHHTLDADCQTVICCAWCPDNKPADEVVDEQTGEIMPW